jgi:hypothetical protein
MLSLSSCNISAFYVRYFWLLGCTERITAEKINHSDVQNKANAITMDTARRITRLDSHEWDMEC